MGGKEASEAAAAPPAKKSKSAIRPTLRFRVPLLIEDVTNFVRASGANAPVTSAPVVVGGVKWTLEALKEGAHLSCYIYGARENGKWQCKADYMIRIEGQREEGGQDLVTSEHAALFASTGADNSDNWGCSEFVEISELVDPASGYILDDRMKIVAELTIGDTYGMCVNTFTAECNPASDLVIRVADAQFHVDKRYLAVQSPVFNAMFSSAHYAESAANEMTITEIDPYDFLEFLSAIYPTHNAVTDDNVEALACLADRYDVGWLLVKCERFLQKTSGYSAVEKLVLAHQFRMDRVKDSCVEKLTKEDVAEIIKMKEHEVRKLDQVTMQKVLERTAKLYASRTGSV